MGRQDEADLDPVRGAQALQTDLAALSPRSTATMRAVRRSWSRRWRGQGPEFVVGVARALQTGGGRWLGYELVRSHAGAFAALDDRALEGFSTGLASWEAVDAFGRILSGPAWAAGLASDALVGRWTASEDRWLRRAALVSTIALNRPADGGRGDTERTLVVCGRLAGDADDMVVKALSWALRVLSTRDPGAVQAFLAAQDAVLAARVRREVGHKMATGLKSPRRAG